MGGEVRSHRLRLVGQGLMICLGCFIYAVGIVCFEASNGIAAGGITGLATVFHEVAKAQGVNLSIGLQTLVINILLLIPVIREGGIKYLSGTLLGIVASSAFLDLLAPVLPVLGSKDLLLAALWGGCIAGLGLGIAFRFGGNTGGTDIIAQLLAKRLPLSVGTLSILCDGIIIALSIPVFSLENALYACVCLVVTGKLIDLIMDARSAEHTVLVISDEHEAISDDILYQMGRGCTEMQAKGTWSGSEKPVLLAIVGARETDRLKQLVWKRDPEALVVVSEAHEVFGEGFRQGSWDASGA